MKVVFPVMGAENISVAYLSTTLKNRGFEVKAAFDRALFDDKQYFSFPLLHKLFNERKKMIDSIISYKPDVLAFSVFADNYQWCLDVAAKVRHSHKCITVWGGIHPTSCPEEIIKRNEVDYLIVGEGEAPLTELLSSLREEKPVDKILNLWFKRNDRIVSNNPRPLMDSVDFPLPDKEIYEDFIPISEYYLTVTSKGCISHCSYCMQNFLKRWERGYGLGSFLREKSVSTVLDELKSMKTRYNLRYIDIKNNILSGNKKWLEEFCQRYPHEVGVPFRIMGHPVLFQDDLAGQLKKAGCHHIQMGIESFNPRVRKDVLLRDETNEQIIKALNSIEKEGINFSADIMVGLPGETEDDLKFAIKTLSKYRRLIRASIFWLQYLPKVDITVGALQKGYINKEDERSINDGRQNNYLSTGSTMQPQRMKVLKTYHIVFRLLPILPEKIVSLITDSGLYKIFAYIPFQTLLIIIIDVFVSFVRNDYYAKWIMGWYSRQITAHIKGKVKTISK